MQLACLGMATSWLHPVSCVIPASEQAMNQEGSREYNVVAWPTDESRVVE